MDQIKKRLSTWLNRIAGQERPKEEELYVSSGLKTERFSDWIKTDEARGMIQRFKASEFARRSELPGRQSILEAEETLTTSEWQVFDKTLRRLFACYCQGDKQRLASVLLEVEVALLK